MTGAPLVQRTAPGTALCLAGAVLALLTCVVPPLTGVLGLFALFNGWRASRAARTRPERYRASAVPLAGLVLVLIAWSFTAVVVVALGAASGHAIHPDPPAAERW